jgi:hypothetical protein
MQREVENTRIDVTARVSGRLTRTVAARGQEVAAGNARTGLALSPVLEDGRFRLRPRGIRSLMPAECSTSYNCSTVGVRA